MPPRRALARRVRRQRLPDLLAGFWFIASLVAVGGLALGVGVAAIDKAAGRAGAIPALVISPDSARTILGSISGSLITIASLTSSLTIVTLQLLSNQYTPRTVRGFLSTRLSQVVLGSFIGIFLYCLVLLVTVREPGDENQPFVPSLGILLAVVLAVVGLIMLVVFIHAMSQTIQVSTMSARIGRETVVAVARVHGPVTFTVGDAADDIPVDVPPSAEALRPQRAGWVRGVDLAALSADLSPLPVVVCVDALPGDFVTDASVVARWWPTTEDAPADLPGQVAGAVRASLVVAGEREIHVDPAYGVRQLVDIALKALSPGINDPTTAITCLGYLRSIEEDLAARELAPFRTMASGRATVAARAMTFTDYLEPLAEVAAYAGSDIRVVTALLDCLDSVARCAADGQRRDAVMAMSEEIRVAAEGDLRLPRERSLLAARVVG